MSQTSTKQHDRIVTKRALKAPIEKVYQAWIDPNQLVRWYLPNLRWNRPDVVVEPKKGGKFSIVMNHMDGDAFEMKGRIEDIVPNERLVILFEDESGNGPKSWKVTMEFKPIAIGTELTITDEGDFGSDTMEQISLGWAGMLVMLESFVVVKTIADF